MLQLPPDRVQAARTTARGRSRRASARTYGVRNSPTVINVAFSDVQHGGWQLWDGRRDSLWTAGGRPDGGPERGSRLAAPVRAPPLRQVPRRLREGLRRDAGPHRYDPVPAEPASPASLAFDNMAPADKLAINRIHSNIGKAIEAYERLLVSPELRALAVRPGCSPVTKTAMTPGRSAAPPVHQQGRMRRVPPRPAVHRRQVPQHRLPAGRPERPVDRHPGRTKGIGLVKMDIFNRAGMFSDDDGRLGTSMNLVEQDIDVGAFKTPSLRNIEKTGPYMHDGVYTTLVGCRGALQLRQAAPGSYSGVKEAAVSPLLLTNREMDDIVEFLRSLSDGPPAATDLFPEGLVAAPVLPL